jgi:uncharacterized protein YqfB (UPF0267 family)
MYSDNDILQRVKSSISRDLSQTKFSAGDLLMITLDNCTFIRETQKDFFGSYEIVSVRIQFNDINEKWMTRITLND